MPVDWQFPPSLPVLAPDAVHVWRVGLDAMDPSEAGACLSPDEQARAARFVYPHHRRRFVAARAALRRVLGRYLALPPEALAFTYGPYGKPALAEGLPAADLHFNLSHSEVVALLAVAQGRRVGVDVEQVRPDRALPALARRFFSPREVAAFEALPPAQWVEGFFNGWTRKEAYLKATGKGLTLGLHRFSVSLTPGEPPVLLETLDDPADADRWSMHTLEAGPGYAGALLAEGHDWTLQRWQFDG